MKLLQKIVQNFTDKSYKKDKLDIENIPYSFPVNEKLIKRYTKSELALLYNRPVNTLMRWINTDEDLIQELKRTGYNRFQKELKKEQVRIIFKHLGEPDCPQ